MVKTIVIVDDEQDIRDTLADYIETLNHFKTYCVGNGNEAVLLLENTPADLVISDIRMPQGDGIFLIKHLKDKIAKGLNFVFMTGYSDVTRNEAISLGAKEIFYKPFDLFALGKLVVDLLDKPKP